MWLHDTLSQGFGAANTDRQQVVIITTAQCGARHMLLHEAFSQGFPAANRQTTDSYHHYCTVWGKTHVAT